MCHIIPYPYSLVFILVVLKRSLFSIPHSLFPLPKSLRSKDHGIRPIHPLVSTGICYLRNDRRISSDSLVTPGRWGRTVELGRVATPNSNLERRIDRSTGQIPGHEEVRPRDGMRNETRGTSRGPLSVTGPRGQDKLVLVLTVRRSVGRA